MLVGETAAAGGVFAGVAFAGRGAGGGAAGLLGAVEGCPVVPLPASLAPSAPAEVLTGAPTGRPGSPADFGGASVVDEGPVLTAGGAAAAVAFESGAGSSTFPRSFASFFASEAGAFEIGRAHV